MTPTPPDPLPGDTAWQEFRGFLLRSAVVTVALVAGVVAAGRGGSFGPVTGLGAAAGGLLWYVLCTRWLRGVGDRFFAELDRGYVTFVMERGVPPNTVAEGGGTALVEWDLSTVWVRSGDGRQIRSAPADGGRPAGFYVSPNRPGREELWTGAAWAGVYLRRARGVGRAAL